MDLSKYTIQGSQDIAQVLAKNNIRWLTLRWYYMVLLAAISMIVSLLSTLSLDRIYEYAVMLFIGYVANAILLVLAFRYASVLWMQRIVVVGQIALDLITCCAVIYVQGGLEAQTTMLFAIPIVASGLSFMRKLVMPVATVSGLLYVATILGHALITTGMIDWPNYAAPVVFYPLLFLVLGRVVEFLTTSETNDVRERTYDSFLSLLAHQLKHPASASKAIIDVIQHDDSAHHTEQTQHYLEMLRGESENQVRLIDNLLEAAPQQRVDMHTEPVNVVLLLEKAAHQAAQGHERKSDLVRDYGAGGVVMVDGNPIKLQLALANIFDNSFRHTRSGTAVHYGVRVEFGVVEIKISDDGDGIGEERLKTIKKRFAVGNIHDLEARHVGGLGLGLYIAQQIVTAHEGTLTVQSKEGHGTTVEIRMKGVRR